MSDVREAFRKAASVDTPVSKDWPLPTPPKVDKRELAEYRREVESVKRATDTEMDKALAGAR